MPCDAIAGFGQPQVALYQSAIGRTVGDVQRAGRNTGDRFTASEPGAVQLYRNVHRVTAVRRQPHRATRLHRAVARAAGKVAYVEPVVGEAPVQPHLGDAGAERLILISKRVGAHQAIEARRAQPSAEIGRHGNRSDQLLVGQPGEGK